LFVKELAVNCRSNSYSCALHHACVNAVLCSCDDGWTAGQTLYIATDAAAAVIPGIALSAAAATAAMPHTELQQQRKHVDPVASKTQPAVAAAVLRANITVDLSGVLEAEHAFWDSWSVQVCTNSRHFVLSVGYLRVRALSVG
jgi:hypothetical protein